MSHICISNPTIIGSDNGLSPGRRQAIIWTNAGILLIGPWRINFNEILIDVLAFSFKKMCLKLSSAKWRPFCLGLNVLAPYYPDTEGSIWIHWRSQPVIWVLNILWTVDMASDLFNWLTVPLDQFAQSYMHVAKLILSFVPCSDIDLFK